VGDIPLPALPAMREALQKRRNTFANRKGKMNAFLPPFSAWLLRASWQAAIFTVMEKTQMRRRIRQIANCKQRPRRFHLRIQPEAGQHGGFREVSGCPMPGYGLY